MARRTGEQGPSILPYTIVTVLSGGNTGQASVDLCNQGGGSSSEASSSSNGTQIGVVSVLDRFTSARMGDKVQAFKDDPAWRIAVEDTVTILKRAHPQVKIVAALLDGELGKSGGGGTLTCGWLNEATFPL